MTDSESEISNSNVFTFQNANNTTVSAKGPNTNITNFSFRSQLTSTMCMPRNFERQRYAESVSDQRSIYYRRETSPMSIRSACDMRPRNYYQQYYNGMGSSHKSVYNGRSGSPMSMRSIDSTASVSATDIAFAFKNVKFNKYDLKVIKDAYHKLMKQHVRKRIEKRRNMRLFLKGSRCRSGDDSGDQGSDSSISSDDCRSAKTSYKENISSSKSARIDLSDFRKTVRDSNMVKDCTDNFRQNNLKNMLPMNASNFNRSQHFNSSSVSKQSHGMPMLKERFQNGFLLPSQRFNRSIASSVISENIERNHRTENEYQQNDRVNGIPNKQLGSGSRNFESASEEEIFSQTTIKEKSVYNKQSQNKRGFDSDDETSLPNKKKSKISSPPKNLQPNKKVSSKVKNSNPINNNNDTSNSFEFAKPTLPVRKSKSKVQEVKVPEAKVQEVVIAKSKQPLTGFVEICNSKVVNNIDLAILPSITNEEKLNDDQTESITDQSESTQISDSSMRPSFIKRKLFTQRLDVADKANTSSDGTYSPQSNVYSAWQKEKNKTRKLVTSQSCLINDVQDDSNLLDLIHKIVPPDRINVTNHTTINQTAKNQTVTSEKNDSSIKADDDDKWDVTSVISMCNDNDVSDTFTDEEIFKTDKSKVDAKKNPKNKKDTSATANTKANIKTNNNPKNLKIVAENNGIRNCKIVLNKLQANKDEQKLDKNPSKKGIQKLDKNINKNAAPPNVTKNAAKTFWDFDFESDVEAPPQKCFVKDSHRGGHIAQDAPKLDQEFKHPAALPQSPMPKSLFLAPAGSRWLNNTKNTTVMNNTLDNTRKFNISSIDLRTHRTSKKKKCCINADITLKPAIEIAPKPVTKSPPKPLAKTTPKRAAKNTSKPAVKATPKPKAKVTPKQAAKNKREPSAIKNTKPTEKYMLKSDEINTPKPTTRSTPKRAAAKKTPKLAVRTTPKRAAKNKPESARKNMSNFQNDIKNKSRSGSSNNQKAESQSKASLKKSDTDKQTLNKSRSTSRTRKSPRGKI